MDLQLLQPSDFACDSMEVCQFSGWNFTTEYVTVRVRCDHGFSRELTFTLLALISSATPDAVGRAAHELLQEADEWHGPPSLAWMRDLGWFDTVAAT